MTPARLWTTILTAFAATAVAWILLDTWTGSGHTPPPLGWAAVGGTLVLVLVLVGAGFQVRQWIRGQGRIDPLTAARVAVLAKAGAYGGALLFGWYLGQALDVYPDLVGARRTRFIIALLSAASAVALIAAGFVVQFWCQTPHDDESNGNGGGVDRDQVP